MVGTDPNAVTRRNEAAGGLGPGATGIASATVRCVRGARVDLDSRRFGAVSARLAVADGYRPRAGDGVLVAAADSDFFVVGVVRALRDAGPPVAEAALASAALVLEHRAGKSVASVADDLVLRVRSNLAFTAGGEVRVAARRAGFEAREQLTVRSSTSELALEGDRARLRTGALESRMERADLHANEANFVVAALRTSAHRLRQRAESVERHAGRVIERAREVYREIDELSQTEAGRIRVVAETAMALLGEQMLVAARKAVKVKGEKIHLG